MMRIRVILVRIRIRILVSVPLTNGSGCGSRRAQNIRIRIRMGNKFGLFCNMPMQYGNSLIVYHTLPLDQWVLHCFDAYLDPDLTFQYRIRFRNRIRIRIGSGFNRVSGSGSGFRIRTGSRRAKMTHKSRTFVINSYFECLDGLF
jgi:hypothetical protein